MDQTTLLPFISKAKENKALGKLPSIQYISLHGQDRPYCTLNYLDSIVGQGSQTFPHQTEYLLFLGTVTHSFCQQSRSNLL